MDINFHHVRNIFQMKIHIIMIQEQKIFFVIMMVFGPVHLIQVILTSLLIQPIPIYTGLQKSLMK